MKTELLVRLSDETLVARFKNTKNSCYFKLIVSRYQKRLYNTAFRVLENNSEAEEIVQETFIRVLRNFDAYRASIPFAAWLFTITHNLCKDVWRTRQRKRIYETISFNPLSLHEHEDGGKDYGVEINQIADKLPEPAQLAEYAEQKMLLAHLLTRLPDNQKKVIVLHDLEGFSYQQIADFTGVGVGTVRSRIYYARGKLKEIFKLHLKKNARRKKRLRFNP